MSYNHLIVHHQIPISYPFPSGATVYGWDSPRLIVPIVLAALLFPSFCWWEASQDERYAMLPVAIMKEPKFLVVCYAGYAPNFPGTITY